MRKLANLFVFTMLIGLLSSCGGDDENGGSASLIGTWNFSSIKILELTIDGKDAVEYFVSLGLSAADAQAAVNEFQSAAEEGSDMANVKIEFKSDNTYVSTEVGEPDETGTWSLSDDGKKLTIDSETFDVSTLTSSKLIAKFSQEEVTDSGTIKMVIEFSFAKI